MEKRKVSEIALVNVNSQVHGNSPAEMIRMAVSGGADLDKLEKLLSLQERYEANEAKKSYHIAMAEFKSNAPKIEKDKTVSYKDVKYNHASLANVVDKISTELSKHGLSASWSTKQNGVIMVTCKITHIQGHSEETTLSAPADATGSKNPIQAIGSAITYLERYTILALTGLATTEMDDDGKGVAIEYISEQEKSFIVDSLAELSASIPKFLEYMGLESLDKMPKSDYQKAIVAISTKRNQRKA
jgi:hypothetical protein